MKAGLHNEAINFIPFIPSSETLTSKIATPHPELAGIHFTGNINTLLLFHCGNMYHVASCG